MIFALFSVLETCVDFILVWIPFYYACKVAFLLYAQLPMFRGAEFLYRQVRGGERARRGMLQAAWRVVRARDHAASCRRGEPIATLSDAARPAR